MPKFKSKTKRSSDYMDNTTYIQSGTPKKEGSVDYSMSVKSLKGLPHSSYSFMADPYTSSMPKSEPYAILNAFNRTIGGQFTGVRNLDGGNVKQYSNSIRSSFLQYYDYALTGVGINYRYIPSLVPEGASDGNYPGLELINEQRKSIAEGVSLLKHTTFTQMEIYNYAIETDMAMGSAAGSEETVYDNQGNSSTATLYKNLVDVLYAFGRWYQLFLLETVNTINWHNSFRLKMGTMIRSAWNREVPNLNGLFGLFKKKSFLSLIDSLCLSFQGEYVDTDFMRQTNMLNLVPSRRSNSITDPLLEVSAHYNLPTKFNLYYRGADGKYVKLFDYEEELSFPFNHPALGDASTIVPKMSWAEACRDWGTIFSATDTALWARNTAIGDTSDTARYNAAKWRLDVINQAMTKFKVIVSDFRQVLDTVSNVSLVSWVKGFRPSITKDTDAVVMRNLLVDNIYAIAFGGATKVDYDVATKRWRTFSLWNMYDGIPEYDAYSGGAFLTLSLKQIDYSGDSDGTFSYLPIGITPDRAGSNDNLFIKLVNRDGHYVIAQPYSITIKNNQVLRRLIALPSQDELEMRVAKITMAATDDTSVVRKSILSKTLTSILGMSNVNNDYSLDPDIISVYQIEIEDITNDAIGYARKNALFRGSINSGNDIGFLGSRI